jgi:hypothetical protein
VATIGQSRLIEFWIANVSSVPITTYTLSNFTITFTRNGVACTDALALVNNGGGSYCLEYTPSIAGRDVINIDDNVNDLHYCDIEDITADGGSDSTSTVLSITQNTGGANALQVTAASPMSYTLYVYNSSDWQTGNTDTSAAVGYTQLDSSGNWLTTPIYLTSGTYHVIIRDGAGAVTVLQAFLSV